MQELQETSYPTASIREYFSVKRKTRNRCCLIFFCIYMLILVMITGLTIFYANYDSIGTVVTPTQHCPTLIDSTFTLCLSSCPANQVAYLGLVCVTTNYSPQQSTALKNQISIYNFKQSFVNTIYTSLGMMVATTVLLGTIICCPKLLYLYVGSIVAMLLAFSFYLLDTIVSATASMDPNSIFYADATALNGFAYGLLAFYLIFLPIVLFSPAKIKLVVRLLSKVRLFFDKTFTMSFFSVVVAMVSWGLIFVSGFVLMSMYSAGTPTVTATSFFFTYAGIQLSNPILLAFYFFGLYWLFATIISWHKCFVGCTAALWYFHEHEKLYPVKRGLKRSWYHLGTAAYDGLLTPLQWVFEFVYKLVRIQGTRDKNKDKPILVDQGKSQFHQSERRKLEESKQGQEQNVHQEREQSKEECISCRRGCMNNLYAKINRNGISCVVITHLQFKEGCAMAAQIFSMNRHIFHNVGGIITLFIGLFSSLAWILVTYFVLKNDLYGSTFPPKISSIALPLLIMGVVGLVFGQIIGNVYTSSIDVILFCYLLERQETKGVIKNTNEFKTLISQCYFEEEKHKQIKMYEEDSQEE